VQGAALNKQRRIQVGVVSQKEMFESVEVTTPVLREARKKKPAVRISYTSLVPLKQSKRKRHRLPVLSRKSSGESEPLRRQSTLCGSERGLEGDSLSRVFFGGGAVALVETRRPFKGTLGLEASMQRERQFKRGSRLKKEGLGL